MTDRPDPTGIRARLARLRRVTGRDLTGVLALTAATDLFVLAPVLRETPGRVLLGVAFLLFAPGYAAVAAAFPRSADRAGHDRGRRGLPLLERLALALVASALLVPLAAVGLTVGGVGVRALPLLAGLNAVTLAATGVAAVRRARLPADARPRPVTWDAVPTTSRLPDTRNLTALDVALATATVLALIGAGVTAVAPAGGTYTELYLLTETESGDLAARDYPQQVTVDEPVALTLGVQNHEGEPTDYTVVVELQRVATTANGSVTIATARNASIDVRVLERTEVARYAPTLPPNGTWYRQHSVSPPFAGERVRLVYLLYRGDPPAHPTVHNAYRTVHLWLDVDPAP